MARTSAAADFLHTDSGFYLHATQKEANRWTELVWVEGFAHLPKESYMLAEYHSNSSFAEVHCRLFDKVMRHFSSSIYFSTPQNLSAEYFQNNKK